MRMFLLLFLIGTLTVSSQKIYSSDYKSQSDINVYVVDYKSQADLLVYKVDYKSQAKGNNGLWFFVENKSYAVGNEQDYHFKVLFLILKKLGFSWSPE